MQTINQKRFLHWMDEQAKIGGTDAGGLNRPALSEADLAARDWFHHLIDEHGFAYHMDGAGSQFARLPSQNPDAKTLLIGSHLDSVPDGGRFDGALGVLAAFEAAVTLKEAGVQLPFHLEVVNFTDEEGTLAGLLGSRALAGTLSREELQHPRGGRARLEAGMARLGIDDNSILDARRNPDDLLGYIEVHIEQGTRLESSKTAIGVVTSIVGIRSCWLTFTGEAAHAGTISMQGRKDAFQGAALFARQARQHVIDNFSPGVVNVGQVEMAPGAFNIVPQTARIAVEFRHGDADIFDDMEAALLEIAQESADACNLTLTIKKVDAIPPAPMTPAFVQAVEDAADTLDLSHTRLLSFAGHDAQSLAAVTNSVMYFVPSQDGISHNPHEYTAPQDCINGANVMLHSVRQMAE
jgi:N-carbamoyl-L-amino-acid hydrolase